MQTVILDTPITLSIDTHHTDIHTHTHTNSQEGIKNVHALTKMKIKSCHAIPESGRKIWMTESSP